MLFYGWELLTVCHHTDTSCGHKHCDSGYILFLISHATSRERMFKGLCEFMGASPSRRVTTLPSLVVIGTVVGEI